MNFRKDTNTNANDIEKKRSPSIETIVLCRREVCFSLGGTAPGTSDTFVLSDDELAGVAPHIKGLRVTAIIENATANCATKVVFQSTDQGTVWGTPVDLEPAYTAGNRSVTTNWYTTATDFKRGIQIGIRVQQSAGTQVESCRVTLVADLEFKQ